MKTAILVGGLGTRLKKMVPDLPKPMADVVGKPFLVYLLKWLRKQSLTNVVLCVGYRWEEIERVLGDGSDFGMQIEYSVENSPLGTGGALKNAERLLPETFIAMNGDSFLDLSLKDLVLNHQRNSSMATLALSFAEDSSLYGSVKIGEKEKITDFMEKKGGHGIRGWVNGGIYVLNPEIFCHLPAGRAVSIERELFPLMIQNNMGVSGYKSKGYFIDIGTPENYLRIQRELEAIL